MLLETYLWLWPRMQLRHLAKRGAYLMGLTLLLIGPLIYVNVDLIRQGFKPSQARLHIEADRSAHHNGTYYLTDDD